jgi:hypothetical protein
MPFLVCYARTLRNRRTTALQSARLINASERTPAPCSRIDQLDRHAAHNGRDRRHIEVVGFLVVFLGVATILIGAQTVSKGAWNDSKMIAKGLKRFRQTRRMTGKYDFTASYHDFPATVKRDDW